MGKEVEREREREAEYGVHSIGPGRRRWHADSDIEVVPVAAFATYIDGLREPPKMTDGERD